MIDCRREGTMSASGILRRQGCQQVTALREAFLYSQAATNVPTISGTGEVGPGGWPNSNKTTQHMKMLTCSLIQKHNNNNNFDTVTTQHAFSVHTYTSKMVDSFGDIHQISLQAPRRLMFLIISAH